MKDKIGFLLPKLTGNSNIYAYRDSRLNTHSSARETLTYAAALRVPGSIFKETRKHIVDLKIEELGLSDAADSVISGFSGLRKGILKWRAKESDHRLYFGFSPFLHHS